jgi:hypothetical protein
MALSAADSGSDAGSMDAEARMSRRESRKRCGESARQLSLAASRSPLDRRQLSGEWKSNQGTKSDRELHVRGDPWAVSVRRGEAYIDRIVFQDRAQAAKIVEE